MAHHPDPVRRFYDEILLMCPAANRREAIHQVAWVVGGALSDHDEALQIALDAIHETEARMDMEAATQGVLGILRGLDPSHVEQEARQTATQVLRATGASIPEPAPINVDIEALHKHIERVEAERATWSEERRLQNDDDVTIDDLCENTGETAHPLVRALIEAIRDRDRDGRVEAAASLLTLARRENPEDDPFEDGHTASMLIVAACNGRWPDPGTGGREAPGA